MKYIQRFLHYMNPAVDPRVKQDIDRQSHELISRADDALYVTKQRTHPAEFGGHDRRKPHPAAQAQNAIDMTEPA